MSSAADRSPAWPRTIVLRLSRPAYIAAARPVTPAPITARSYLIAFPLPRCHPPACRSPPAEAGSVRRRAARGNVAGLTISLGYVFIWDEQARHALSPAPFPA